MRPLITDYGIEQRYPELLSARERLAQTVTAEDRAELDEIAARVIAEHEGRPS